MGEVIDWGGVFMCPDHGWRFEKTEGVCINGPNSKMTAFPVNVESGRLIATVPED
jgi:nitrite reductase/ring-hydroxylating ferredoxin subunit